MKTDGIPVNAHGQGAEKTLSTRREGKPSDGAEARKAAKEVEAYFVQYLMRVMRKSVPKSSLFGDGQAMEIFESMLDEAIGRAVAEGTGLGLAEQIYGSMNDEQGDRGRLLESSSGLLTAAYVRHPEEAAGRGRPWDGEDERETRWPITSDFGPRMHPLTGKYQEHTGVDIAMPIGTPVRALAPGKVIFAGEKGGYGNLVIVEHEGGYTSYYAHNARLRVRVGDEVDSGDELAESGASGRTTGPHLHVEIRRDGKPIDPHTVEWARLP